MMVPNSVLGGLIQICKTYQYGSNNDQINFPTMIHICYSMLGLSMLTFNAKSIINFLGGHINFQYE